MSKPGFAKRLMPWALLVGSLLCLGATGYWTFIKATTRGRTHTTFLTGSKEFLFTLCPQVPLAERTPKWASDMRELCREQEPRWGTLELGQTPPAIDVENSSAWEALQLSFKLAVWLSPTKLLSLLTLMAISVASLFGLRSRTDRQSDGTRMTRQAAVFLLVVVLLALSASLVLMDVQEGATMCQSTGATYANLLALDQRCSQQTLRLHATEGELGKARSELERAKADLAARDKELEALRREIAALNVMKDAVGHLDRELQDQTDSTRQLIMGVTTATLDGMQKSLEPLQRSVKDLEQSVRSDLREGLQSDLREVVREDLKALVQEELEAALAGELERKLTSGLKESLREDVKAAVRSGIEEAASKGPTSPGSGGAKAVPAVSGQGAQRGKTAAPAPAKPKPAKATGAAPGPR